MGETIPSGYKLRKLLDEWSTGALYEGYQASLERQVLLRLDKVGPERAKREGLLAKARRLGSLNNQYIIRALEVGETKAGVFCTMELFSGGTMEQLMNEKGRLDTKEAVSIALQVLTALDYALTSPEGLAHGALIPQVIYITQEGMVKVAEFGMERKRSTIHMGRDAQYCPPEKVSGGSVDTRSDIYSLGMLLHRALSGRLPFPDIDPKKVLMRQVEDMPELLSDMSRDIPVELAAVVETAVRKDPRTRYQTPGQMATALNGIIDR